MVREEYTPEAEGFGVLASETRLRILTTLVKVSPTALEYCDWPELMAEYERVWRHKLAGAPEAVHRVWLSDGRAVHPHRGPLRGRPEDDRPLGGSLACREDGDRRRLPTRDRLRRRRDCRDDHARRLSTGRARRRKRVRRACVGHLNRPTRRPYRRRTYRLRGEPLPLAIYRSHPN